MNWRLPQLCALACSASLCLAAEGLGRAVAASDPGPVILSCRGTVPVAGDRLAAICDALEAQIRAAAPDRTLLRDRPDAADQPGGLRIALVVTRSDPDMIQAHLHWTPPRSDGETGPSVSLGSLDRPILPARYPALARGLMKVTKLPL